jgi:hypothetical protein
MSQVVIFSLTSGNVQTPTLMLSSALGTSRAIERLIVPMLCKRIYINLSMILLPAFEFCMQRFVFGNPIFPNVFF